MSFRGYFENDVPVKVRLCDNVTVTCSASNGFPSPFFTASIVDSTDHTFRNLEEIKASVTHQNDDQTYTETKYFALSMTENDVGKYVQCKSEQGIGFDVVEKRELAIYCGCSKDGSRNLTYCHPKSGQCECYPNYFGMNCDECADGFKDYPDCTGEESKSI